MKYSLTITLIAAFTLLTGCAVVSNNTKLVPNRDQTAIQNFYVIHQPQDKRNIDAEISELLREKGFQATHGPAAKIASDTDILVTYEDRWFWDMSNYLIQLNVEFRDAKSRYPIVAGETIRTSLARKSTKEMASETINAMFLKIEKGE
ncbi:MAG: hypothetical protein JAY85_09865 [Candidatus Thiodiazotropha weberae]|uniref:Lipoprotein n=1 Tax=Candidatus Thiodiazotropha endoloripes TaxID=1818881 RepID=A0A1E2UIF3_9GAMM|nr:hypothetical protein [Candidatus Thiodiazotropha endoloripes]MCG7898750.1 hypothetical protein [Candidatus Thiodiazotropha weberae]ODB94385.1 hypothetical protein A3196_17790 [Candidatus Thiodiazotropha endoloripes]